MGLGARLRRGWLALIKNSLNHLTARAARRGGGPFTIVRTVGRKSGTTFETPIIVQPLDGGFVIELTYGPEVNWYQNLIAANGGEIIRGDVTTRVLGPVPLSAAEGLAAFPRSQRWLLTLLRRTHFAKLPAA